jgi:hypothetical protein
VSGLADRLEAGERYRLLFLFSGVECEAVYFRSQKHHLVFHRDEHPGLDLYIHPEQIARAEHIG